MLENLTFNLPEILSLIGLAQCLYVLVYIVFRSGEIKRSLIPFLYFFVLASAFFTDLSYRFLSEGIEYYFLLQWALWSMGPPLGVLLIVQIARIYRLPRLFNVWLLLLVPLSFFVSILIGKQDEDCETLSQCAQFNEALGITAMVAGTVALASVWLRKGLLDNLYKEKAGQDRYWLILTLIIVNIILLAALFFNTTDTIADDIYLQIRTIIGIALVYLASTSLFRIYPQALILVDRLEKRSKEQLSDTEKEIADKIESLMKLEKVYHDPKYSRAQLAQELDFSEAVISKVINHHFKMSFPQLLNEHRVEDAKRLLTETGVSVRVVSGEVGFNSVSSFNRVFRDITGVTPTQYRKTTKA